MYNSLIKHINNTLVSTSLNKFHHAVELRALMIHGLTSPSLTKDMNKVEQCPLLWKCTSQNQGDEV